MRLVVADDHGLFLRGVRQVLDRAEGIEVVGEAHTGSQVLPLVRQTDADVVLLDIRMPQLDGIACLDRLREQFPNVKVVMLSVFEDAEHIQMALTRGACGYIVKSINPLDLPAAIRQAVEGTVYLPLGLPVIDEHSEAQVAGLTKREVSILKAVARGLSNQAIARELWVTEQTVKFHLTNIYRKLGVRNRTEAARHAYQHGLADNPATE